MIYMYIYIYIYIRVCYIHTYIHTYTQHTDIGASRPQLARHARAPPSHADSALRSARAPRARRRRRRVDLSNKIAAAVACGYGARRAQVPVQ